MESPQEFTARALKLQHEAVRLSQQISGDYAKLNRWMALAKKQRLTWVGGLAYAIECMKEIQAANCVCHAKLRNSFDRPMIKWRCPGPRDGNALDTVVENPGTPLQVS